MRKLFYIGIALLIIFEIANVYFIMPMPYSQRVRSIDIAYRLYTARWALRFALGLIILAGIRPSWSAGGWRRVAIPALMLIAGVVAYMTNFPMSADHMFLAPTSVVMKPVEQNSVEPTRLVVGVRLGNEARAYPVQFIGYHHQVRDAIDGFPILVTFCTVCRTGRVFQPVVDGHIVEFRLVGMDHFNAMLEDRKTGSWWRQATGEAIAGPRKGKVLFEVPSRQVTLAEWLSLYPRSLIMQPDSALRGKYSKSFDYETGASKSLLTGTDTASWHDKSWVVGITVNGESKAYDWNRIRRERAVNDVLGGKPIILVLASDGISFFAFVRPDSTSFSLQQDSLVAGAYRYPLSGLGTTRSLEPLKASQEFWHSWRTFQPSTRTY